MSPYFDYRRAYPRAPHYTYTGPTPVVALPVRSEPAMFPSNEPEWEVLERHLVYVGKWQITKDDNARNYRFLNRDTGLTRILSDEFVKSKGLKNTLFSLETDMKDLERWMDDSVIEGSLIKKLFDDPYYYELTRKDFDDSEWEVLKQALAYKAKQQVSGIIKVEVTGLTRSEKKFIAGISAVVLTLIILSIILL